MPLSTMRWIQTDELPFGTNILSRLHILLNYVKFIFIIFIQFNILLKINNNTHQQVIRVIKSSVLILQNAFVDDWLPRICSYESELYQPLLTNLLLK